VEDGAFPFREGQIKDPLSLFNLFIPLTVSPEITKHTNDYAHQQRKKQKNQTKEQMGAWRDFMFNGLAPWRSPTASTAPHSLDGVLLPAYIPRCLFFLSVLPALPALPAGLPSFSIAQFESVKKLNSCYFEHISNRTEHFITQI
jgi:hypothetical protein